MAENRFYVVLNFDELDFDGNLNDFAENLVGIDTQVCSYKLVGNTQLVRIALQGDWERRIRVLRVLRNHKKGKDLTKELNYDYQNVDLEEKSRSLKASTHENKE